MKGLTWLHRSGALLLVAAIAFLLGCGMKGELKPRDRLPDDESGTPLEQRLYPPREAPPDVFGVGDSMQAPSQPGVIIEHSLTPTPTPTPSPTSEANP